MIHLCTSFIILLSVAQTFIGCVAPDVASVGDDRSQYTNQYTIEVKAA